MARRRRRSSSCASSASSRLRTAVFGRATCGASASCSRSPPPASPSRRSVEAIRDGRITFDFIDELAPNPIPLLPETQTELVERLGLSDELARGLGTILGTCSLPPDQQVRSDHAELFELVGAAKAHGADDDLLIRVVRATAESLRHIIDAQRDFIDVSLLEPAAAAGATPSEMLSVTAPTRRRYRELGRRSVELLFDRFVDESTFQHVVELMETELGEQRVAAGSSAGDRFHRPERLHAPRGGGRRRRGGGPGRTLHGGGRSGRERDRRPPRQGARRRRDDALRRTRTPRFAPRSASSAAFRPRASRPREPGSTRARW